MNQPLCPHTHNACDERPNSRCSICPLRNLSANSTSPQVGEILNKGDKFQHMGVLNAAGRLLPDKTPLYTLPQIDVSIEVLVKNSKRWEAVLKQVGGVYIDEDDGPGCEFTLKHLQPVSNIMRGSVAQHFEAAVDALIAGSV